MHPNPGDDPEKIATALEELLGQCDLVFTVGGVSVGDHDCLPAAGKLIGAGTVFRRVRMKTGGRITALEKNGKVILCLSGNPFAALCNFELIGVPLLRRAAGLASCFPRRIKAALGDPYPRKSPGRRFFCARLEDDTVFLPKTCNSPRALASFIGCNCLVDIPSGSLSLPAGAVVEVVQF
jgi:molybdopterin molybdotransferase